MSKRQYPLILGGNGAGRFSYYCFDPLEVFRFEKDQQGDVFELLDGKISKYKIKKDVSLPEGIFCGGWAGYFSYDLAHRIERLPVVVKDDLGMPLVCLCFYDNVIAFDSLKKVFYLFSLSDNDDDLNQMENILKGCEGADCNYQPELKFEFDTNDLNINMTKNEYFASVERIKRYIYDGDVYQINFSQRFETDYIAKTVALFNWQNVYNPSPYSAYLDFGNFAVVSTSPEMFLEIKNGKISTKPIKGTRKYIAGDDVQNKNNYDDLLGCEKEKAELNMIIDLERNDIAKVCLPGSRVVSRGRTIEIYASVMHALATVEGQLRLGVTFGEIMKSVFPGGSITGAPKVRAMEIIEELEPCARGLYTGSIGYIGADGNACLNIAIRTVIINDGRAYFNTGGGIVADSKPDFEYEETLIKAAAMAAGIKAIKSE